MLRMRAEQARGVCVRRRRSNGSFRQIWGLDDLFISYDGVGLKAPLAASAWSPLREEQRRPELAVSAFAVPWQSPILRTTAADWIAAGPCADAHERSRLKWSTSHPKLRREAIGARIVRIITELHAHEVAVGYLRALDARGARTNEPKAYGPTLAAERFDPQLAPPTRRSARRG